MGDGRSSLGPVARGLVKACMAIFPPGIVVAVSLAYAFGGTQQGPGEYNLVNNFISDLGSARYTPAPFVLDATSMGTSVLLVPVFFSTHAVATGLVRSSGDENARSSALRACWAGLAGLLVGCVGLFGIGLFSEDRDVAGLHYAFSVVVFVGFAVGSCAYGLATLLVPTYLPRHLGVVMLLAPPASVVAFGVNSFLFDAAIPEPLLEWLMLLCIFWWILPGGYYVLQHQAGD